MVTWFGVEGRGKGVPLAVMSLKEVLGLGILPATLRALNRECGGVFENV